MYISDTLRYERNTVQGFLKKKPKEKSGFSLFDQKLYRRFFILDHENQRFLIMNSNAKNSKFLEMTYTDIQNVKLVDDPSMPYNSIQKRWSFEFIVQTTERVYRLIAASIDERCLFMHTF